MSDDSAARTGGRPRSKALLSISLENAYAQLGVSPLASTDEIAERISDLLSQARKRVRAKASKAANDPDEAEILRLQKVDREIGEAKRRAAYDEQYPQNILLTVQPSLTEQSWQRHRRAGLVSEWLHDSLGETALVPSPRCLSYWAPAGVDPAVLEFLEKYAESASPAPAAGTPATESDRPQVSIADLERLQGRA